MTGARQRRAYRAALRRIEQLKATLFLAMVAGDEDLAAATHVELCDLEHEARVIEGAARRAAE